MISLTLHFCPKLLLNSCHKNLLFNSPVSYTNIFKTSVSLEWFLRLEYFQTWHLSVKLHQDVEKFYSSKEIVSSF